MAEDAATLFGPSSPEGPLKLEEFERRFWEEGLTYVAGVDEAGRGALAGPVVAAAVVLPPGFDCAGIRDSKRLDAAQRDDLYAVVAEGAASWAVGVASRRVIDDVNILNAALLAMRKACGRLAPPPDLLLVDGNRPVPTTVRQKTIVKGDARCVSIAAASIMAKVYRDRLMMLLDDKYPAYGFAVHKGYGTAAHLEALAEFGPSPAHRRSFAPVARCLGEEDGLFRQ
jgi:ribonuclease HII